MRGITISLLALIPFVGVGCSQLNPPVPVPPNDEVVAVKVHVQQIEKTKWLDKPHEFTLTAAEDIAEVTRCLQSIDWKKPGRDLAPIDLPPVNVDVELQFKSGAAKRYGIYWEGNVADYKANTLHDGAKTDGFKQLILRKCK